MSNQLFKALHDEILNAIEYYRGTEHGKVVEGIGDAFLATLAAHEAAKPAEPVAWPSAAEIADEIDALLPMSLGDSTKAAIEEWWRQLVARKLSKIAAPVAQAALAAEPFIQRYSVNKEGFITMDKGPKGGWVKYEDHRSVLARACAAPVAVASPLTADQIEAMPVWKHFIGLMPEHRLEFTRAIEAHHGIKEQA